VGIEKMVKKNIFTQIKSSREGALMGASTYSVIVLGMILLDKTFYTIPNELFYLFSPASLLQGIVTSETIVLGIPSNILFLNLVIYTTMGYFLDWIIDPYK
jgi:hypothetical protein